MNILLNENGHHISTYSIGTSSKSLVLWHERMGYMNEKDLRMLLKQLYGITFPRKDRINCEICKISKSTQQPFNGKFPTATSPMEIIYSDIAGPLKIDPRGYKYVITYRRIYRILSCISN